jgi:hypothetical protein
MLVNYALNKKLNERVHAIKIRNRIRVMRQKKSI